MRHPRVLSPTLPPNLDILFIYMPSVYKVVQDVGSLGVRNAIISNFNALDMRNDIGQLWENFALVERLKYRSYHGVSANQYFWRTWQQNEIDLVEERGGKYHGYEFKWSTKRTVAPPKQWQEAYQHDGT